MEQCMTAADMSRFLELIDAPFDLIHNTIVIHATGAPPAIWLWSDFLYCLVV